MSKRSKIILMCMAALVVVISLIIMIIFIIDNKSDNPKLLLKDDRLTTEAFSNVLNEFDNTKDVTIKEECLTDNNGRIIKLDFDEASVSPLNDESSTSVVYYKNDNDKYFKYSYENSKLKRRTVDNDSLEYKINFNLKQYNDYYKSFTYDEKESLYKLNQIDNDFDYTNIEIKITDKKVRHYRYTSNEKEYLYTFTYYGNTEVSIPNNYEIIYDKLQNFEWVKLINATKNVNNFTLSSTYKDEASNAIFESNEMLFKANNKEATEIITSGADISNKYYKINGSSLEIYEKLGADYSLVEAIETNIKSYNQGDKLPLELLIQNYDNLAFNEKTNSYTLKNIEFEEYNYLEIVLNLIDNHITYISINYTYMLDDKLHNVHNVINFKDFDNTKININA